MPTFKRPSLLLITLLSSLLLSGCNNPEAEEHNDNANTARPAKIVPVLSEEVKLSRIYPGVLEASDTADLAFRVGGHLEELIVVAGSRVKKGDLLASLDKTDFINSLATQQARYKLAQVQFNQIKKLQSKKLASELQFEQASAELKAAKAALDQAQDNLRYTELRAPFGGTIAQVDVENYQAIQVKAPVMQIHNDQQLDIRFSVPESLINQLLPFNDPKLFDKICGKVRFSAHPERAYNACHKEHEVVPDPLTRTYFGVFTVVDRPNFIILPGMSATIALDLSQYLPMKESHGIFVPVEAVFEEKGKRWVWRVDEQMQARLTEVKVGRLEKNMLEITSGLSKEQHIIAAGIAYIREGMKVRAIKKERGL